MYHFPTYDLDLESDDDYLLDIDTTINSGVNAYPYEGSYTITPTQEQQILPTRNLLSVDNFTINAIPSGTAGVPIATKGEVDNHTISITPSVTNAAGYVTSETKIGTPITVSATELDNGVKDISANGTNINVIGYAAVNVDVNVSPSLQSKSNISPVEHSLTISADSGYDGLSAVQINAIPSDYIGSNIALQSARFITPGTTEQTIPSGRYLTGIQTIAGDSNLIAGNIRAGTSIFGVTGNYEGLGSNHTATIVNRSNYIHYSFVEYNGQTYKNLNDTFTFQAGDTLIIETDSQSGGGKIYINENLVASDNANKVTYNYTLPDYDIQIVLFELGNEGTVYVSTPAITISSNSRYDVSSYNYADVEVAYASQSFYEGIPIFTITSDVIDGIQSITCNKTYEECVYQMYQYNGTSNTTAIIDHHAVHNGGDYGHSYSGTIGFDEDEHLQYGPAMQSYDSEGNFAGWLDIYWANGSDITLIPSTFDDDQHFIITCSYNTTTDLWEPNRTFEEIDAACKAGKEVVPKTTGTDSFVTGYYMNDFPDEQPGTYIYIVVWHDGDRMIKKYYAINSDGIEDLGGSLYSWEPN